MKKIAIFENEFKNVQASFDAVNLLYFNNELSFELYNTSQEFGELGKLSEYDLVVIDIDLTPRSELDGYQIIDHILALETRPPKIAILTGHVDIERQLEKRGIKKVPIITKPVIYEEIKKVFTILGSD